MNPARPDDVDLVQSGTESMALKFPARRIGAYAVALVLVVALGAVIAVHQLSRAPSRHATAESVPSGLSKHYVDAQLGLPGHLVTGMVADRRGGLWLAIWDKGLVVHVSTSPLKIDRRVKVGQPLNGPLSIAADASHLWAADFSSGRVDEYSYSGSMVSSNNYLVDSLATDGHLLATVTCCARQDGRNYFTSRIIDLGKSSTVLRLVPGGGEHDNIAVGKGGALIAGRFDTAYRLIGASATIQPVALSTDDGAFPAIGAGYQWIVSSDLHLTRMPDVSTSVGPDKIRTTDLPLTGELAPIPLSTCLSHLWVLAGGYLLSIEPTTMKAGSKISAANLVSVGCAGDHLYATTTDGSLMQLTGLSPSH